MKPGFGPVFQFRAAFSVVSSVDELWMTLNIMARSSQQLGSQQANPVFHPACSLVRCHGWA